MREERKRGRIGMGRRGQRGRPRTCQWDLDRGERPRGAGWEEVAGREPGEGDEQECRRRPTRVCTASLPSPYLRFPSRSMFSGKRSSSPPSQIHSRPSGAARRLPPASRHRRCIVLRRHPRVTRISPALGSTTYRLGRCILPVSDQPPSRPRALRPTSQAACCIRSENEGSISDTTAWALHDSGTGSSRHNHLAVLLPRTQRA